MKNLILLSLLSIPLLSTMSCHGDTTSDYPVISSYTQLHTQILNTELNIYQDRDISTQSSLNKIVDILDKDRKLFCPFQNVEIKAAIDVAENLNENISVAGLDFQLDQLRLLKRHVYNLNTESERDFFILYLWNFEEQMYHSTATAMDDRLDLHEWNEFVEDTKCLSESWNILSHHYPSPQTLDYDELKYKTQVIVKDELKQATEAFIALALYGQADQSIVSQSAKYLRKKYIEYLSALVNDPMQQYVQHTATNFN